MTAFYIRCVNLRILEYKALRRIVPLTVFVSHIIIIIIIIDHLDCKLVGEHYCSD